MGHQENGPIADPSTRPLEKAVLTYDHCSLTPHSSAEPHHPPKGMRNQEMRCLLRSSVKLSRNAGTPVEPLAAL